MVILNQYVGGRKGLFYLFPYLSLLMLCLFCSPESKGQISFVRSITNFNLDYFVETGPISSGVAPAQDSGYFLGFREDRSWSDYVLITKYDKEAVAQWSVRLDSFANSEVALGGSHDNGVIIGGNQLIKLNDTGGIVWQHKLSNDTSLKVKQIELAPDSGLLVFSEFPNTGTWLWKFAPNGTLLWKKQAFGKKMVLHSDGTIFLFGAGSSVFHYDGHGNGINQYTFTGAGTLVDGIPLSDGGFILLYDIPQHSYVVRVDSNLNSVWSGAQLGHLPPGTPHSHGYRVEGKHLFQTTDSTFICIMKEGLYNVGGWFSGNTMYFIHNNGQMERHEGQGPHHRFSKMVDDSWIISSGLHSSRYLRRYYGWENDCETCIRHNWDTTGYTAVNGFALNFTSQNLGTTIDTSTITVDTGYSLGETGCIGDGLLPDVSGASYNLGPAPNYVGFQVPPRSITHASCYYFDFGDGTVSLWGAHTYSSPGIYTICVIGVNSAGRDTMCFTISNVEDTITASLSLTDTIDICTYTSLPLVSTSTGFPTEYLWITPGAVQDSSTYHSPNAFYTTPGVYDITLIASNSISSDTLFLPGYIHVHDNPDVVVDIIDYPCYNDNNGTAKATALSGTPPFTYSWAGPWINSNQDSASGLMPGANYVLTLTDSTGCTSQQSFSTPSHYNHYAYINTIIPLNSCEGDSVTMGYGNPLASADSVIWSHNGQILPWQTGNQFKLEITPGITQPVQHEVTIQITDTFGCVHPPDTALFELYPDPVFSLLLDSACVGGNNGGAQIINPNFANQPGHWVQWNTTTGAAPYSTNGSINTLPPGNHSVIVKNGNNCFVTTPYVVPSLPVPVVSISASSNSICQDQSATLSSDSTWVNYQWYLNSSSIAGADSSQLIVQQPGNYYLQVVNDSGCTGNSSYLSVGSAPSPQINFNTTNPSCFGSNDGGVNASVSSGLSPYTYLWNNGQTSNNINALSSGTYLLTVTDASGCSSTDSANVISPAALSISKLIEPANCSYLNNGEIDITVSGGTSPYSYLWSSGGSTSNINNLAGGTYTVTVTDNNGCTSIDSALVNQPSPIITSLTITAVNCFGQSSGAIDLSVSGGVPSYQYAWSNSSSSEDLSGLPAGPYQVTVTDNQGCTMVIGDTISQPPPLTSAIVSFPATCGSPNGALDLTAGGGNGPYTFNWSEGSPNEDINNLISGTYSVSITDALGCVLTDSAIVIAIPMAPLGISNSGQNSLCQGQTTNLVVSNNNWLTFQWLKDGLPITGATAPNNTVTSSGVFQLIGTDSNGCTDTSSAIQIIVNPLPQVSATGLDSGYCYSDSGITLVGLPSGGNWSGLGVSGSLFTPALAGVGYSQVTYTYSDSNSCVDSVVLTTEVFPQPNPVITGPLSVSNVGAYSYSASGMGGSSFSWIATGGSLLNTNGNQTDVQWGPGFFGTLQITETTTNGCLDSSSITVDIISVGIGEQQSKYQISLFPNPNSGNFQVQLPEQHSFRRLEIYDALGKMIYAQNLNQQQSNFPLLLQNVATGLYTLNLLGTERASVKFLVQ